MIGDGFVGRIPVRNIWVLMAYAFDLGTLRNQSLKAIDSNPNEVAEIIVRLLNQAVRRRLREGLAPGYEARKEVLRRVRGKINMLDTVAHQLIQSGQISCSFHELTFNTERNRYLLAALKKAAYLAEDSDTAATARSLARTLNAMGVEFASQKDQRTPFVGGSFFRKDQAVMALAHLVINMALPAEEAGNSNAPDPEKEERWVRRLFEKAMKGFFALELNPDSYRVTSGGRIKWPLVAATQGLDAILPTMQTDIVIDGGSPPCRLVIDTKFNEMTKPGWHREQTLRSGYLYQIYSYLRTQEETPPTSWNKESAGLLLHPSIGVSVREQCLLQGHLISFATVDLAQPAHGIADELREIHFFANGGDGQPV